MCELHYARWRKYGSSDKIVRATAPEVRFWPKVAKSDGCWEWMGSRKETGYGLFTLDSRTSSAHRFSYSLAFGSIPAGMEVCHHCDNPPCVRPDHMFLGTHSDNMRDRFAKGRHRKSEGAP
jgi:hypothetical protein